MIGFPIDGKGEIIRRAADSVADAGGGFHGHTDWFWLVFSKDTIRSSRMTATDEAKATHRSGGRRRRQATREASATERVPFINRHVGPLNILSDDGLSIIEQNADAILRDVGMEFQGDPSLLELWKDAGADVQGERVRFEPGMCRQIVQATAPKQYTQHARNPDNNVEIGGSNTVLCPSFGPAFVHDLDRGRRYSTLQDFHDLVKIHHTIPWLHHSGGVVCEPVDIPVNKRHLDMLLGHFRFSDRGCFGALIGEERAKDSVAMAQILFGEDFVDDHCVFYSVANTNAPLVLDSAMSGALKTYAPIPGRSLYAVYPGRRNESLHRGRHAGPDAGGSHGGLRADPAHSPGAPCLMGSFATAISMQSGAPTYGNPEGAKLVLAAGQLARRLGVPFHTVGALSASKLPDAQAEQEATWGLTMAVLAGANFINHATGWLEGGLVTGFRKTMIDADLCGKIIEFCRGIDLDEESQAMAAIYENRPGQHFLSSGHTLANYETAFFRSAVADNNSFEQWDRGRWAGRRHPRQPSVEAGAGAVPRADPGSGQTRGAGSLRRQTKGRNARSTLLNGRKDPDHWRRCHRPQRRVSPGKAGRPGRFAGRKESAHQRHLLACSRASSAPCAAARI